MTFARLTAPETLRQTCHLLVGRRMPGLAQNGRQFVGLRMATMLDCPASLLWTADWPQLRYIHQSAL